MSEFTPMMQQYLKTKESYPDCILFYRLGDFYEMFFEDAKLVSKELELTLTGKNCGQEERAPMCGIPHHAIEAYLPRLVERGYKVAICEQVEDPKLAKGIVKREVTRIVTPGTNVDALLETSDNLYIASVINIGQTFGYAYADISTGEFCMTEYDSFEFLLEELQKRCPKEIIGNSAFMMKESFTNHFLFHDVSLTEIPDEKDDLMRMYTVLSEHFLELPNKNQYKIGVIAAGKLFSYLKRTQLNDLSHMQSVQILENTQIMGIDGFSFRNLELLETMREKEKKGSLFWVLDKTKTAMGARMLSSYIRSPLMNPDIIQKRLDAVEEFSKETILREELREYLQGVYDLERLLTRVSYRSANPRDLISFRDSIYVLPAIKCLLSDCGSLLLKEYANQLDPLEDLFHMLQNAINDDAPIGMHDGDIIKSGYLEEIDHLRKAKSEGKQWLANLEEKERNETGIKNLKIKYNRVFGYYLEVTNSYQQLVPDRYIRKQTLANCERFFTPELKDLENTILGAQDKLLRLEYECFKEIVASIAKEMARIQLSAHIIAGIDVMLSFATVSVKNRYVRPMINQNGHIVIKEGRHPVVEQMMNHQDFVPNDTSLDMQNNRLMILTGPNMAGKSTYMRQSALIVLMAQIGCFVPAKAADIGIVDRIFTRVGASDDLASGQSTFMVEMHEMANILSNASRNSFIILDEIGRGTSTFDGLSIAWAVAEYIHDTDKIGAKTMFATHYHEMTELENELEGVKNYSIAVKERGDDIIFLRKIIPGGADKSYGIQVAQLAGVPAAVTSRAKELLEQLIQKDTQVSLVSSSNNKTTLLVKETKETKQLSFFDTSSDILRMIENMDLSELSPREAMNLLYEIQEKLHHA